MRITLRYLQRLGDICQLLHTAHVLNERGHEVAIECWPKFADILVAAGDYVRYSNPYAPLPCDVKLHLGVHPDGGGTPERYAAYRQQNRKWSDFVLGDHELTRGTYGPPVFKRLDWFDPASYGLPSDGAYAVVAATGYSQVQKHSPESVMALAKRLYPDVPIYPLSDKPGQGICVKNLRELPGLLAHAKHVLSINTSAAIISAGVRRQYHHIPQLRSMQDDTSFAGISIQVQP
jgi:hypothetical protein